MKRLCMKQLVAVTLVVTAFQTTISALESSTPGNVVLAQEYVASKEVISNLQTMLNLFQPPKGTGSQMSEATHTFKQTALKSLSKLLELIQTQDFTAFLKERDKIRQSALNQQAMNGAFANAYTSRAAMIDEVNKHWQQVKTALQSITTYELLLSAVGENSEIKLRDRLAPIANVLLKILQ